MSPLYFLYFVLPFVGFILLHELEICLTRSNWWGKNEPLAKSKFPKLKDYFSSLASLTRMSCIVVGLEKLMMVMLITIAIMSATDELEVYSQRLWVSVVLATEVCLLLRIFFAVVVRKYVPGLVTAVIGFALGVYLVWKFSLAFPVWVLLFFTVIGLMFVGLNEYWALRLGNRVR